jgi:mRNA interferase MazF
MPGEYRRGQIYYADLNPVVGHEQAGRRPVLIIQNDIGNRFAPTVIVAAVSSSLAPKPYPTEVRVSASTSGLSRDSTIRLDQIRTVDKRRLQNYVGQLDAETMHLVDEAIKVSLGLVPL